MTNHPNRSRAPYTAVLGGDGFGCVKTTTSLTIREARAWAEGYGHTADWCEISDKSGHVVASHRRDKSTDRWYRATP